MHVIDNAIAFLQAHPEIDVLLSSLRGEHPRPVVNEAARPGGHAVRLDLAGAGSRSRGPADTGDCPPTSDAKLVRLISSDSVRRIRNAIPGRGYFDVRTVLADFGALIESSPVVQPDGVLAAAGGRARLIAQHMSPQPPPRHHALASPKFDQSVTVLDVIVGAAAGRVGAGSADGPHHGVLPSAPG